MADTKKYYVMCGNKCLYEGMTKEQILTAIQQAISTGEIKDVDTGFITKVKEQNRGVALSFWLGTTAEYNAIKAAGKVVQNCLYILTDETFAADMQNAFEELLSEFEDIKTAFSQVLNQVSNIKDTGWKSFLNTDDPDEWINYRCKNGIAYVVFSIKGISFRMFGKQTLPFAIDFKNNRAEKVISPFIIPAIRFNPSTAKKTITWVEVGQDETANAIAFLKRADWVTTDTVADNEIITGEFSFPHSQSFVYS